MVRLKGSALRHSVERLVLDTVSDTFLSPTLHFANDPCIGQQKKDLCRAQAVNDIEKRSGISLRQHTCRSEPEQDLTVGMTIAVSDQKM